MEETFDLQTGTSSIKLTKNSKGYNWDIKVYDPSPEIMISQIEKIDKTMREKYGSD